MKQGWVLKEKHSLECNEILRLRFLEGLPKPKERGLIKAIFAVLKKVSRA